MEELSTLRGNSRCFNVLYYLILLFCFCFYFLRWIVFQMCDGINGIVTCGPVMLLLVPSVWWVVLWCCGLQPRRAASTAASWRTSAAVWSQINFSNFICFSSFPPIHSFLSENRRRFCICCSMQHIFTVTLAFFHSHWHKHTQYCVFVSVRETWDKQKDVQEVYFYLCFRFFFFQTLWNSTISAGRQI